MMIQVDIQERPFENNPRFTYVKIISTGISGEVLLGGRDSETGVEVVIKQPNKLSDDSARGRHAMNIWNEAQALRRLQSLKEQDVCQLLASARKPDNSEKTITYAYIITTRAQGQTLETLAEEYKRPGAVIPWLQILAIMERLSGLLVRAHHANLIYNDVKPEHIFWDQSTAQLKLIDWGNVVFYDHEKEVKQPCDDIAQVGELLYQLITGQRPGATLDFGVASLPAGLREVIEKALRQEYTTMSALHSDLERLYQEQERLHRAELDKIAAELSVPDLPMEKLNTLERRLSDWSAHAVHTTSTEQALGEIHKKVKQYRLQVEWRNVVMRLEESDYGGAQKVLRPVVASLPLMPDLPEVMNLHLVDGLVAWELSEGAPNTEIEGVIRLVVSSDEKRNLEALWKVLGMRETFRPGDKEVIHETIYWLSRKVNKPTIQANLTWLERHLDELAKYQQDTTTLRSLKRINLELFDQIVALPQVEPELTPLYQTYSEVVRVLKKIVELLDKISSPHTVDLKEATEWLSTGAQQLSDTLKRAQEAFARQDHQEWEWLDEVQLLDLSNARLQTWCETARGKLSPPPLPPILGREGLSQLSDVCALLAASQFSQATEVLRKYAETGSLKSDMPEYAYYEVLQAREQAMREWENGQYADACATFQSVEKALDLYQEQPAGKVLADHIKCLTGIAIKIVARLSSANNWAMDSSPADNKVWEALGTGLCSIETELRGQLAATGGLRTSQQIGAHQKLREIYQDQRADFADAVARVKQQTPPHPFVDVYEAWATGEVPETQERYVSPPVTKPGLPDFSEVEELILARKLGKAQGILSRIEQENPQVFASSEGYVYKVALERFRIGIKAIGIGNYAAAVRNLDQAIEAARNLRQQHVQVPLVEFMTDKREKIDILARRLNDAATYVQNGHIPRPGQQAWERFQNTLKNNATEAYDNAFPWDKQALETQPGLHAKLHKAYERKDAREYTQCLEEWEKAYENHPFTPVYRAWGETLRKGWYFGVPAYLWIGGGALVMFLLIILGGLVKQALLPPTSPTPLVAATENIVVPSVSPPTNTPASTDDLSSICRQMATFTQNGEWEQVLLAVENARDVSGEALGAAVTAIPREECDFAGLLAQAGKSLAQQYYDQEAYQQAAEAVQRVLALLTLPGFPEVDAGMHRDMVILQSCADYQRSMAAEDLDAAGGALDLVSGYVNENGFQNTFIQLCGGLSLPQAQASIIPSEPTEPPASPIILQTTQPGPTPKITDGSCMPKIPTTLVEPADQASQPAGFGPVTFKWEGGQRCDGQVWQVTLNDSAEYCQPANEHQTTCIMPNTPGTYQWRVEIWQDGKPVSEMISGFLKLIVQAPDPCASDKDGDGVNDCKDRCKDTPGPGRNDGCPEG